MTGLATSSGPTLLGKLQALEERLVYGPSGPATSLASREGARHELADLLPQIIAQIERQSAGNARYEYLRSMTPRQYSEFHAAWMRSGIRFDDYVDALVAERRAIVANAIKERT